MLKIPRYRRVYYEPAVGTSAGLICPSNPATVGLDELAMPCFTISLILSILHNFLPLQPGKKIAEPPHPSD